MDLPQCFPSVIVCWPCLFSHFLISLCIFFCFFYLSFFHLFPSHHPMHRVGLPRNIGLHHRWCIYMGLTCIKTFIRRVLFTVRYILFLYKHCCPGQSLHLQDSTLPLIYIPQLVLHGKHPTMTDFYSAPGNCYNMESRPLPAMWKFSHDGRLGTFTI